WRIGTVLHAEWLAGIAINADGDVIVADARAGLQIKNGLDADRALEENFPPFQAILRAVEIDFALKDFDAAQQSGLRGGTAEAQVGVAREVRDRGLHLEVGRGDNVHVEFDAIQWRGCRRHDHRLRTAVGIRSEIEAGRYGELGDRYVPAQGRALACS